MQNRAGTIIAAAWIFGAAAYYYFRFTIAFYGANRAAIEQALERLANLVGLG